MKDNERQLPAIGALISAVKEFFAIAKLARTSEQRYQDGWSIRRLIVKLTSSLTGLGLLRTAVQLQTLQLIFQHPCDAQPLFPLVGGHMCF